MYLFDLIQINIGMKIASWLNKVGVFSEDKLHAIGAAGENKTMHRV